MNGFKFANLVCVLALAAATSMWPADGVQAEDAEGIVQQRKALAHRQRRIIFNNDGDDAMRAAKAGLTDGLTFVTGGDLREDFLGSRTSALANTDGFHHVQLACSRNLTSWTRLADRQPFIDTSPVGGDAWDTMLTFPPSAPLVRGDELWFYYTAGRYRAKPPSPPPSNGAVCLAVLRGDGFMSLDAGEKPGTLLTKPFVLTGTKLLVNADATDGALDVEVLDTAGNTVAVSEPVLGDQPHATIQWMSSDLADLKGKTITLRFKLRTASLYSFWVGGSQ